MATTEKDGSTNTTDPTAAEANDGGNANEGKDANDGEPNNNENVHPVVQDEKQKEEFLRDICRAGGVVEDEKWESLADTMYVMVAVKLLHQGLGALILLRSSRDTRGHTRSMGDPPNFRTVCPSPRDA